MNCLSTTEYIYCKLSFSDFIFAISGCPCNYLWRIINSEEKVLHFWAAPDPILYVWDEWKAFMGWTCCVSASWKLCYLLFHKCVYKCAHTHTYRYIHTHSCKSASHIIVQCGVQVKHCLKVTCFSFRVLLDFSVSIYSFATPDKFLFFWLQNMRSD